MPVVAGDTLVLPAGFCAPLQAPLAVQVPTPTEDQVSTAVWPTVMVDGTTPMVMLGVGVGGGGCTMGNDPVVPKEQAKKEEACAQMAARPTHQKSSREREWRLFK